jgi:hypothetical protein
MSTPTIRVEIREIYGQQKIYPVCDIAHHFARIADAKTLTTRVIQHIKSIGYRVEVMPQTIKEL